MFDGASGNAVGGLVTAAILGALGWAVPRIRRRRAKNAVAEKEIEQSADADRRAVLLAQVLATARARDILLPVQVNGTNPTRVELSDGGVSNFYTDRAKYIRDMQSHRVDPLRSFGMPYNGGPPVSKWTAQMAENWLRDNAI